ncbi:hypothetical protein M409DRAFT_67754 [Zasmidium cellare ATCC 36951]|uniref:Velvet domain-containing protein n=1 Tax=Zasmidium cellare ATCC 36951 TaxID=1080233 RepID=A0A6A6CFC3_ZASCE|nr:uncharacterized protein M409DRAFT_67754 [Zasmidium cellare ATCC 36951]KAF2164622.1 hypothetical protein M409DRAFT_67754 [Zasmidium cellare ATCC 36951]
MARSGIQLIVRQQPTRAQVVQENNPKNRKPIDPPPIIELKYDDRNDPQNSQWLVSPRTFMMVILIPEREGGDPMVGKHLIGQTVSSLHRLKDINNKDGGFFVFGDISARKLGRYKLRFSLFDTEKEKDVVTFMGSVDSESFPVLPQRDFGSMSESTHLTRTFSDQGVKLRVRKDNRAIPGIGSKRSFNASPPETTSPGLHSGMYGGAVQDHHYGGSVHSPAAKRHRSGSEYDSSHMYQHMPMGDSAYGSSIPSATRYSEHSRVHRGYNQQQSPMSLSMMGRVPASMGSSVQTPGWQNMHQTSALPSPASTSSNTQQPSYPSVTSQQQSSSLFGDPGSASSIPRNYYSSSNYQYSGTGQYPGPQSGEVQSAYSDLHQIPDAANLTATQSQGYGQGYMPYATEPSEVPGAYAYIGEQKF